MFNISVAKAIVAALSLTAITSALAADSSSTQSSGSDSSSQFSSLDTGAPTTENLGFPDITSSLSSGTTTSSTVSGNFSSSVSSTSSSPPLAPSPVIAQSRSTLLLPSAGSSQYIGESGTNAAISATSMPALQDPGRTDDYASVLTAGSKTITASAVHGVFEGNTVSAEASAFTVGGQVDSTGHGGSAEAAGTGLPEGASAEDIPSSQTSTDGRAPMGGTAEPSLALQANDAALSHAVCVTGLLGMAVMGTWFRLFL